MRSRKTLVAVVTVLASASLVAAPGAAAFQAADGTLPEFDARRGDAADVANATEAARARIDDRLGAQGIVSSDPVNGGIRSLGATDDLLTGPSDDGAMATALDYVAGHPTLFGLDSADIAALRLAARYTSPDGVTHLSWYQTDQGIHSYDTFLSVNVASDGSIVNVTGSPVHDLSVPSADPALSRADGAAAAADDIGNGSHAAATALVIFAAPAGDRLAWRSTVTAHDGLMYDVVVDAATGDLLARHSLSSFAGAASVFPYHPGAAAGGSPIGVNLFSNGWLAGGATTLNGPFAHAYADVDNGDDADPGEEIAPLAGDWNFAQQAVACGAAPQNPSNFTGICTWDGVNFATETTNRSQATTQLFYLANNFHDWLAQPPIGFDNASHNFEVGGAGGSDPVLAEADDGGSFNNANMSTPADGQSPRMQMYLFKATGPGGFPAINGSDDASVVYHEYTHGLSNRLINNGLGGGLQAKQSRAMGEGWSDWYAFDYLAAQGFVTDTPADGDIPIGEYVTDNANTGIRRNALDCPVGSANATKCPGSPTPGTVVGTTRAGPGGYGFDDVGKIGTFGVTPAGDDYMRFEEHDDGEVWAETLWDLRTALGAVTARGLITNAMRLAPVNPSFIDMRDAILQADAATGGAGNAQIWQVFATRGLGFGAGVSSANATRVQASFATPPVAGTGTPQASDPAPLGDGDGVAEPGETIRVQIPVTNPRGTALTGVTGTLSSSTPEAFVGQPTGSYGSVAALGSANAADAYAITIPISASCAGSLALDLTIGSDQGSASGPISLPLGALSGTTYTAAGLPQAIPDPVGSTLFVGPTATLSIPDAGIVDRMRVTVAIGHQSGFTHTLNGDFQGRLTAPGGTSIELFERAGPFNFGSNTETMNVVFDDRASAAIQSLPRDFGVAYLPAATGSFRPDEPLSRFTGQQQQGAWKLRLFDALDGDAGALTDFKIETGSPVCSTTVTPPTANTDPAGSVAQTSAVLNGTLNPAGAQTDYLFQFGTTSAYGQTTPVTDGGTGSSPGAVSAAVSGLAPNTDFHYRLVAQRAGVPVAAGTDQTFHTPAPGGGNQPSNLFNAPNGGKANLKKGTLTLKVELPGAGVLEADDASGNAKLSALFKQKDLLKPARAEAKAAGKTKITLKPSRKGLKKLKKGAKGKKTGKLKVPTDLTFTPTGGTSHTETKTYKLKLK